MLNPHIPPCGALAQGQPDPKSIIRAPSAKHIIYEFFGVGQGLLLNYTEEKEAELYSQIRYL